MPVSLQWHKADLWLPGEAGTEEGWDGGVRGLSKILPVMDMGYVLYLDYDDSFSYIHMSKFIKW